MEFTLAELAKHCRGRIDGNPNLIIKGVGSLHSAGPDEITCLSNKRYQKYLELTKAGAVLMTETAATGYTGTALVVEDPRLSFARLTQLLYPRSKVVPGIHATAVVDSSASVMPSSWVGPGVVIESKAVIGEGVSVGAGCYIGTRANIGLDTILYANVTVGADCRIGKKCIVNSGVVVGGEGFGFAKDGNKWEKIPQLCGVVIGDDVEIGANSTIDRGALIDTVISSGVKIDNLVHIGHNVQVGEDTIIAGCVGIAGSTIIGKRCSIGGMAGIRQHLEIADDVMIAGMTKVTNSIREPGIYSSSFKAEVLAKWQRNMARLRHLDDMAHRLKELERRLENIKKEQTS